MVCHPFIRESDMGVLRVLHESRNIGSASFCDCHIFMGAQVIALLRSTIFREKHCQSADIADENVF